jgi:tetratricopeptide (TPR) repeat protein
MADAALVAVGFGQIASSRRVHARNAALPVSEGPPAGPREFAGLVAHAYFSAADAGAVSHGLELARRALAAPPPGMPSSLQRLLRSIAALPLMAAEHYMDAEAVWDELLRESRADGSRSQVATWCSARALVRQRRGQLAAAEADAMEALELQSEIAGAEIVRGISAAVAIVAGLELGRPIDELLELAEAHPPDPDMLPMNHCYLGHGALRLAVGDPQGALERYMACDRVEPGWGRDCPALLPWRSGAAQALAMLERADEAEALASEEVELARRQGTRGTHGAALRVLGRVGDPALRRARFEAAVAALEDGPFPLELARALIDLGGELRRGGERIASRPLLVRAYGLATAAAPSAPRIARGASCAVRAPAWRCRRATGPRR